jgi:hypothetical protein
MKKKILKIANNKMIEAIYGYVISKSNLHMKKCELRIVKGKKCDVIGFPLGVWDLSQEDIYRIPLYIDKKDIDNSIEVNAPQYKPYIMTDKPDIFLVS